MKALLAKLNVETFVLDTSKFSQAPELTGFDFKVVDDHTIEVEVAKEKGLNPVFAQLDQQGVQVLSMRNKANRLEELFVRLVEEGNKAKETK